MGVNSLPKTVTRQRRVCDLNQGPSAPESSMLTTRLQSHLGNPVVNIKYHLNIIIIMQRLTCHVSVIRMANRRRFNITHSVYSRHLSLGGIPPPKKKYNSSTPPPKKAGQIVRYISFFDRGNELQIYHENFLMDTKHRKLFVLSN